MGTRNDPKSKEKLTHRELQEALAELIGMGYVELDETGDSE